MANIQTGHYKDIDLRYKVHPMTGDIVPLKDLKAIGNALKILLTTKSGERLFNPFLSANVEEYLFEPLNRITISQFKNTVIDAINRYEPRVVIKTINITQDDDKNTMNVFLDFSLANTDLTDSITIEIERIR